MPTILLEQCTACMKCVKDCPSDAINIKTGSIADTCIHCGHCVAICPEGAVMPDTGKITALENGSMDPGEYRALVAGLRSIRYYLKKEVPVEMLEMLVENMRHYSSASNARPIKITIVNSPEKIQQLNDMTILTLLKAVNVVTSPLVAPVVQVLAPSVNIRGLKNYRESFYRKKLTNSSLVCHHAPAVMLLHGPVTKYGMADADAWIWATHTTLYAKTLGLGSCFIGFIVKAMERSANLRKEFGVPDGHGVYAALTLGWPKNGYKNETSRQQPEVKFI